MQNPERQQERYSTENWCRFQNINDFGRGSGASAGRSDDAIGEREKVAFSVSPMAYKAHILITKASGVNV